MTATPIYASLVEKTGIVPEQIYKNAKSLTAFYYPATATRTTVTPPRPGQRPVKNKRKGGKK